MATPKVFQDVGDGSTEDNGIAETREAAVRRPALKIT